jgi:ParB-like chromosome segregation protein Spo0J
MTTIRTIDVNLLDASPTQPRKHFSAKEHEKLTASLVEHGFAFGALLVRAKIDERFEIVIGERRTRAAKAALDKLNTALAAEPQAGIELGDKIASLRELPCKVSELPDYRIVELQLVENLQRDDLTAIEEAEGYQKMLDLTDPLGARLHTIDSIAKRLGRSRDTIERRLVLCNLDDEAKRAVEAYGRKDDDGDEKSAKKLSPYTAYLIARIPDPDRRAAASKQILHPIAGGENGVLTSREAEQVISENFMRDLRRAPFDQADEQLVPVRFDDNKQRCAGGACGDCPFRSANIAAPQSDPKKKKTGGSRDYHCLQPVCYDEKIEAEWRTWQAKETNAAENRVALDREESFAKFDPSMPADPTWSSGLVDLAQYPASNELQAGEEAPAPWRKLIGKAKLQIFVVRDRNYKTHELVERKIAIEAAKADGHTFFKNTAASSTGKPRATRKELGLTAPPEVPEPEREQWEGQAASREESNTARKEQEKAKAAAHERLRLVAHNCFDAVREKITGLLSAVPKMVPVDSYIEPVTEFLRKLALFIFGQRTSPNEDLLKRHKLPVTDDIARNITKWTAPQLIAFMVEFILTDGGHNFELDKADRSWLKIFGVDYDAEEKRLTKLDADFKKADEKAMSKALKDTPEKKAKGNPRKKQ